MNPGQQMFYNFIMERVEEDKREEAQELLAESFARQAAGTFDRGYFQEIAQRILDLVKPEAAAELQEAMEDFGSRL
jgi:hypothetical protein